MSHGKPEEGAECEFPRACTRSSPLPLLMQRPIHRFRC
jgi:hypothetical protein